MQEKDNPGQKNKERKGNKRKKITCDNTDNAANFCIFAMIPIFP